MLIFIKIYLQHFAGFDRYLDKTVKGLEAKGPFLCLGLQVRIKKAYQIPINYLFFCPVKYNLNNSIYYLNIIFESYAVLITKLQPRSNKINFKVERPF